MAKLKGVWFKGNIFGMSSKQMIKSRKYEKGVKKPTAVETKKINGKPFSRYFHKPLTPGELD